MVPMQPMVAERPVSSEGRVQRSARSRRRLEQLTPASRCRHRFLRFFPGGFRDETYLDWERGYKAEAHSRWDAELGRLQFHRLLNARRFQEIATRAVRIESRTNLLFSFEKMALRDAVKTSLGARRFASGLYEFLHGRAACDPWRGHLQRASCARHPRAH